MLFSVKVKFAECVIIVQSAFILFLNFFIGVVLRMSQAKVAFDLTFKGSFEPQHFYRVAMVCHSSVFL